MSQRPAHRMHAVAPVVSLEERRTARSRRRVRALPLRPLVALWFGTAVFAVAMLLGLAASLALSAPAITIPAGIVVAAAASWPAAGAWLAHRRGAPPERDRVSA